jgi:NAD(P)-dependent dehydrogenase (short-subunit alcohol dehydrogenase family)
MGKNVLITGASGNLGKAAVEQFLTAGYSVIAAVSPGAKAGFEVKENAIPYEANLTDEKSVQELIAKIISNHKTIDVAILTVGGFAGGSIATTDGAMLQKMMEINFHTAYFVARPVFFQMLSQSSGRIILIGSRPGLVAHDGKNAIAYALSKSLVFKLAELLNAEAKGKNVVTSVIVPGTIDTSANRKDMPTADFSSWVTASEIAKTMLYLASEDARSLREPVLKMYSKG